MINSIIRAMFRRKTGAMLHHKGVAAELPPLWVLLTFEIDYTITTTNPQMIVYEVWEDDAKVRSDGSDETSHPHILDRAFAAHIHKYAFEEVENRTDILSDYSIKMITKDTQGHSGLAARRMFELMNEGLPIVAILGPSLSHELTITGQIAPFYDVIELSYIATTSSTIDRKLFPTLFRVNQVMSNLNPLRIKMMQYFNWTRVGTIYNQDDIASYKMNLFHELLTEINMTLVTSAVLTLQSDIKALISRFVQYDVRIIMATFHGETASKIFCEAYKQGLYGSNYVWVIAGPILLPGWIDKLDRSAMECTFEQFLEATNGHFSLNYDKIDSDNVVTVSNKTPTELTSILKAKIAETGYKWSSYYGYVYDTAWSLALGLNNSLSFLNESGLKNYSNNPYYLDAIRSGMREVNFAGLSGPVSFDETGGRVGVTHIEQNFYNTRVVVARYNHMTGRLKWLVPVNTLWPGVEIPQDRFIYHQVLVAPNTFSLVLILIINTFCAVTALGFLVFNIYYRKNSNIKLSSPMINNIIIAGSMLMFLVVLLTTLEYGHLLTGAFDRSYCMLGVWVMCLGFTSLFGALFSKTWRVHIIFRDYKLKKTPIKDYHLFGLIVFLLFLDCVLLISWSVTHPLQTQTVIKNIKDADNLSSVTSKVYRYCYHRYEGYWFAAIYIYKGLLLIFGTFLAWETRHVTIPALNDSKYIGFCIYNVIIMCAFGVPLTHALPIEETTMNFVLPTAMIMFCTTMCLCILFIPKIRLRKQVNERFLNPSMNSQQIAISSTSESHKPIAMKGTDETEIPHLPSTESDKHSCQNMEEIQEENKRLRMTIAAETIAMTRLKRDLLQVTGNVNFYKSGGLYVVFRTDTGSQQAAHSPLNRRSRTKKNTSKA